MFLCGFKIIKGVIFDYFDDPIRSKKYSIREGKIDLGHAKIGAPNAGARFPASAVIYAPRSNKSSCVFVSNSSDGWITLVNRVCKDTLANCLSLSTTSSEAENSMNSLRFYRNGGEVRLVRAMKDLDRWEFFEKGDPLPFEDTSIYKRRKVSERLNRDSLLQVVEKAGFDLRNPDFWKSDTDALYIDELR